MTKFGGVCAAVVWVVLAGSGACTDVPRTPLTPTCERPGVDGLCPPRGMGDCASTCPIEDGFACGGPTGESCAPVCGDGLVRGDEGCDGGETAPVGCVECRVRAGFECEGAPSVCRTFCGDGQRVAGEACDDGGRGIGDGCDQLCLIERGYMCEGTSPSVCRGICGDGIAVPTEGCDDGNVRDGDGCSSTCLDSEFWRPLAGRGAPSPRTRALAVAMGTDVFVYGGYGPDPIISLDGAIYDTIRRSWRSFAPYRVFLAGDEFFGVWTGAEVIVWSPEAAAGVAYDPLRDTWRRPAVEGGPPPRVGASVLWTGRELIVWGGQDPANAAPRRDGAAYDPVADDWRPLTRVGEPSARAGHSAVWTGTEMIVWGGRAGPNFVRGGGRYDPEADAWAPLLDDAQIQARAEHSAVWTGEEMIVWGGAGTGAAPLQVGGAFAPATGQWRLLSTENAPAPRARHQAHWSGSEMFVWGGALGGAKYIPATDQWVPMRATSAPGARYAASEALVDGEIFIWGGSPLGEDLVFGARFPDGGLYAIESDTWSPIPEDFAPEARFLHSAVWTGTEMILWGGSTLSAAQDGERFDPASNRWSPVTAEGAPSERGEHTATWTGTEMIVFGGVGPQASYPTDAAAYDPALDRWRTLSTLGGPSAREQHSAVWTGREMLIWGGYLEPEPRPDGARYSPAEDHWRPIATADAPSTRWRHVAVWMDREMFVWGGTSTRNRYSIEDDPFVLSDGGLYDPETNTWRPIPPPPAGFEGRSLARAVWTGREVVIVGGAGRRGFLGNGARFDPENMRWSLLPTASAPSARIHHSLVWTGHQVVVWGGIPGLLGSSEPAASTGARYDPVLDAWFPTPSEGAPTPRWLHSSVATPFGMLLWGGTGVGFPADGALLSL